MQEVSFSGVFVPAALLWAGVAFFLSSLISRLLSRMNFYDLVWHRALFDFAMWLILWAAISAIPYHAAFSSGGWAER
jgi:protein AaeX